MKISDAQKGQWVEYQAGGSAPEVGRIKTWDDTHIFVVYSCAHDWDRYEEFTGVATAPGTLRVKEV